jgi:hypothetical protein
MNDNQKQEALLSKFDLINMESIHNSINVNLVALKSDINYKDFQRTTPGST